MSPRKDRAAPTPGAGSIGSLLASSGQPGPDGEVTDNSATELARGSSVHLTNRELEIVHLLLSGFSSKGIAQKLKISPETVKGHRKHIYTKLGVHSRMQAVLAARRAGAL